MVELEKEVMSLRKTIFSMLNYANMYVLVLDGKMNIKFANQALAKDLGFEKYRELTNRCWIDFIPEPERKVITTIHRAVAEGKEWNKFKEFQNNILTKDGNIVNVHWFNSHINTEFNWSFSFGIRQEPTTEITPESIRTYYKDIINKDRTMINAMKQLIVNVNIDMDTCEPKL